MAQVGDRSTLKFFTVYNGSVYSAGCTEGDKVCQCRLQEQWLYIQDWFHSWYNTRNTFCFPDSTSDKLQNSRALAAVQAPIVCQLSGCSRYCSVFPLIANKGTSCCFRTLQRIVKVICIYTTFMYGNINPIFQTLLVYSTVMAALLLLEQKKQSCPLPQLACLATPHLPAWARFDLFDVIR